MKKREIVIKGYLLKIAQVKESGWPSSCSKCMLHPSAVDRPGITCDELCEGKDAIVGMNYYVESLTRDPLAVVMAEIRSRQDGHTGG